jgi:hypothetical protein
MALYNNTGGTNNTASGFNSLFANTSGSLNTATGVQALLKNTTGQFNTAVGVNDQASNTTGQRNTSLGVGALFTNTTGTNNIAVGVNAAYNPAAGSNNIEIGNVGVAADTNMIRLGTQGTQTKTFIAGIAGSAVTGSDVVVNGNGQLGVVVSSARYKRDINDMGTSTAGLMRLRPVTFRYKGDPEATKQYGLVAEEVEQVYPELVVHDDAGKVESVRYSMLTSMLLNELQKQTKKNEQQTEELREQTRKNELQSEKIASLEERLVRLEQVMAAKEGNRDLAAAFSR